SHGSPGYAPACDSLIANNTIVATKNAFSIGAQTRPVAEPARNNRILNNVFATRKKGIAVGVDADGRENVFDRNLLWAGGSDVELPPAPEGSKNLVGDPLLKD